MNEERGHKAERQISEQAMGQVKGRRFTHYAIILVVLLIVATGPLYMGNYWERVFIFIFISIALAQSWNIIGGFAGYFSFGHGVFFGIGAYAAAQFIIRYGLSFWLSLPLSGLTAAVLSFLLFPILRIKGFYFAMATLGTLLAVQVVFKMVPFIRGLKGGDFGWLFPEVGGLHIFYFLMLSLLVLITCFTHFMVKSKFGYALRTLFQDEIIASCMGVPTTWHKCMALMASAFWAGVIGGIYGPFITYISTESAFALHWTLDMMVMTLLGGVGTVMGPVVGGFCLAIINQLVWSKFVYLHVFIYGLLIVIIILFLPSGIMASIKGRYMQYGK